MVRRSCRTWMQPISLWMSEFRTSPDLCGDEGFLSRQFSLNLFIKTAQLLQSLWCFLRTLTVELEATVVEEVQPSETVISYRLPCCSSETKCLTTWPSEVSDSSLWLCNLYALSRIVGFDCESSAIHSHQCFFALRALLQHPLNFRQSCWARALNQPAVWGRGWLPGRSERYKSLNDSNASWFLTASHLCGMHFLRGSGLTCEKTGDNQYGTTSYLSNFSIANLHISMFQTHLSLSGGHGSNLSQRDTGTE